MAYEEFWLKTSDNLKLQGWFIYQPTDTNKRNTIVFFHENAGNLGLRLDWFELVYKNLGVNIIAVAYRGFSRSEGKPGQDGILIDREAILSYVKHESRIDNQRVFILGRSLGGAVATHTVAKLVEQDDEWIAGVILENTFTSINKIADGLFPFLKLIPNLKAKMLRLKWESHIAIAKITKPILFVGGTIDALCPVVMTKELYACAVKSKDKQLYLVQDGDHNTTYLRGGL